MINNGPRVCVYRQCVAAPINTCKMSSWSCDCFCLILSSRRCLSTCQESQVRIWETMRLADDGDRPTSRFWHSCAELVGRPIHLISFFSLEMMFMAMRTFSASYTRRRMFFWSYTCFENTQPWRRYDKLVCLKASGRGHHLGEDCKTHCIVGRHVVVRGAEFCHQLISHFVVGGDSFLLDLLTHFHWEMPQAFAVLFPFLSTFPEIRLHYNNRGVISSSIFWKYSSYLQALRGDSPRWPGWGIRLLGLSEELGAGCVRTVYQNSIGYCGSLRCSNHLQQKTKKCFFWDNYAVWHNSNVKIKKNDCWTPVRKPRSMFVYLSVTLQKKAKSTWTKCAGISYAYSITLQTSC